MHFSKNHRWGRGVKLIPPPSPAVLGLRFSFCYANRWRMKLQFNEGILSIYNKVNDNRVTKQSGRNNSRTVPQWTSKDITPTDNSADTSLEISYPNVQFSERTFPRWTAPWTEWHFPDQTFPHILHIFYFSNTEVIIHFQMTLFLFLSQNYLYF